MNTYYIVKPYRVVIVETNIMNSVTRKTIKAMIIDINKKYEKHTQKKKINILIAGSLNKCTISY